MKKVVSKLKKRPPEDGLIRCCVRLLASSHQFHNGIFQETDVLDSLRDFSLQTFMKSCDETNPLVIQNCMDCCTLVSYADHEMLFESVCMCNMINTFTCNEGLAFANDSKEHFGAVGLQCCKLSLYLDPKRYLYVE